MVLRTTICLVSICLPASRLLAQEASPVRNLGISGAVFAGVSGNELWYFDQDGGTRDQVVHVHNLSTGETRNLAGEQPQRAAALAALGEAARSLGADPLMRAREIETELSPQAIENLRALGYLN